MARSTEHPPSSRLNSLGASLAIFGIGVLLGLAAFCALLYFLAARFIAGI